MDLGNKNFETIAAQAQQIRAIGMTAYFNPSGCAGAKKAIESKVAEISELLKALPE
jgi:hypothetical protein